MSTEHLDGREGSGHDEKEETHVGSWGGEPVPMCAENAEGPGRCRRTAGVCPALPVCRHSVYDRDAGRPPRASWDLLGCWAEPHFRKATKPPRSAWLRERASAEPVLQCPAPSHSQVTVASVSGSVTQLCPPPSQPGVSTADKIVLGAGQGGAGI